MFFSYFIASFIFINIVFCNTYNSEKNIYNGLPSIFHIDDYEICKSEKKTFCKATISLKPSSQNFSQEWKLIQRSLADTLAYNHDKLFHAICVQNFCPKIQITGDTILGKDISECYNDKYISSGLSAEVVHLKCGYFDNIHKPGMLDFIWLIAISVYIIYIFVATFLDYKYNKNYLFCNEPYIAPFSLIRNFKKFKKVSDSPDYQKLKSMQGIRFYNMLLIIFCHTYSSYIGGYVMNTEYIENIPQNSVRLGMRNLMVFLVQTFFLFSGFLLSYHFFQIMENKRFNSKIVWLTFLNRYLRIAPLVVVVILMGSTVWIVNLFYGPIKDLYADLEYYKCQKNWWTSLLFINNHINQYDMCYFTTWYLAADTQIYALSLIILAIIWKNKEHVKYALSIIFLLGILIPITIAYVYNLDIIFRITPENSTNNQFRSFKFSAIYSSTYANMATYTIGLWCGYFYFKLRKLEKIVITKVVKLLWYAVFFGLPILVVTISSYYYSRFLSALLCGTLKPLYALGIAVGIFGMSLGLGGKIKKICEWEPVLVLGNLTFSTYMIHFAVVFYRTATAKEPMYISDFVMVKSFLIDAVLSYFFGFLMHLFVELPAASIQSMIVPQVRNLRSSVNTRKPNNNIQKNLLKLY